MALVKSGTFGSGPAAMYELHADQISGSGTNRTVKVTLKLKVNGSTSTSKYGYGLTWKARVKDTYSGNQNIKGNEYWYGGQAYREFSQTINANIGTTASSSIVVGFQLWRTDGGSSSWNQTITGNYTVTNTNTAPYFPSGQQYVTIREGNNSSGTVLTGVIPENISQVFVHWGKASDNEGDSINYSLQHQVNNGNWSQIDYGADQEHSYTIGAGNQGQTLKYSVDAVDKNGAWSTKIYSNVITKNTFTGSNLSDIAAIYYNTTELKLTWSAPSNTTTHANANAFNFSLTCDGLTLYNANATNTTTSLTFKIVNSALTDGTPYILKNDLKNKFQGSAYKGSLAFTLTSSNAYGSSKTSTKICAVDLQSTPNASSSASISTDAAKSTCYQKPISSVNTYYFIPDGSKTIRVEWSAGSGKIGEPISYDVYVAYGSDSWTLLQSNLTTTYYNHVVPKQNISRTIKYRIATKTNYGTSAFKDTATQTLHYYNLPTITIGNITRAATTATVPVTVKTETSLSGVTTVGTWSCVKKGTTSAVSSGNLTTSQTSQNIAVTGLTDTGQFELKIVFKDNTIFSSNANAPVVNIGQVSSIFFVNKYGVGINGAEANDKQVLVIRGAMGQNAGVITDFNNALTEGEYYFTASTINGPVASRYGKVIVKVNDGGMHNNSSNWIWQIAYLTDGGTVYRRNKTNAGAWSSWVRQYDTGYKPSAADIGLGSVNNWGASSDIGANSTTQYATTSMVAKVRKEKLNSDSGVHTGALTISENSKQLVMGCGTGDVFFKNSKSGGYLQFYDDKTLRIDGLVIGDVRYPVIDRNTNRWFNKVAPVMSDGVMEIGRYIDFHKDNVSNVDYTVRLDANGSALWCSTSIQQGSDRELKENIKYIDEGPMLLTARSRIDSPFKDFIRDFRFATYNYKGSEGKCFGFIAQDIADDPIGQLMLQKHEMDCINKQARSIEGKDVTLAFNLADYTSIVAKALQEEIVSRDIEIEELNERVTELEKLLNKNMESK